MKNLTYFFVLVCLACQPGKEKETAESEIDLPSIEAVTLLGDTLFTPSALDNFKNAKKVYESNPDDANALIWYGRRTAYLGLFQDAIAIYTTGIEKFPEDARMYRHRGHRYISTRQYDKAIADFEKAAELIEGSEDQIEPDGQPNDRNIPLSTLHGNIWYHLGLAYYLKNDMENALRAYSNRTVTERYDDNIVSGGHWLYMIQRRMGLDDEADSAIEKVHEEMEIIENTSYFKMCLFYNGLISEEELQPIGSNTSSNDVYAYSIGNWYLYNNQDTARAKVEYEQLLENGNRFSFAYLAAESDYWRLFGDK